MNEVDHFWVNREKSINAIYMSLIQSLGFEIKEILSKQGLNELAIYGMGEEGIALYHLLISNGIIVKYVTDRNYEHLTMPDVNVINPNMINGDVDAIIVSTHYYYEEIKQEIQKTVSAPVYSARVILENVLTCCKYKR